MRLLLGLVVAIALGGPSSALAQAATTPEACASAAFTAADAAGRAFDGFRMMVPGGASPSDTIASVTRQIQDGSRHAQEASQGYEAVIRCGSPTWTVAALVRQGQMYQRLAWAVRDVSHQFPQYPPAFGERLAAAMDPQIAPVDCLAMARFLRAVRVARSGAVGTQSTGHALEALLAYDVASLSACAADQHERDSTFAPFTPGDLQPL